VDVNQRSTVRIAEDVLSREVKGEELILDLEKGEYFGLDPVGTFVWKLLREPVVVSDVVEAIVSEFEVTPEKASVDVIALLQSLYEEKLISLIE
jgi:hypothetical protein